MPSEEEKGGLSVILGLGSEKEEDTEDRSDPKTMAAETLMDAMKANDVDLFMVALDDYLEFRGKRED